VPGDVIGQLVIPRTGAATQGRPIVIAAHSAGTIGKRTTDTIDGLQIAERLSTGPTPCPVILFTPEADAALAVEAMRVGAADCVADIDPDCGGLRAAIDRALRNLQEAERAKPARGPVLASYPAKLAAWEASAASLSRLENDLRLAMSERQLQLHYQPRVDLTSGLVVGAEALLRWPHPRAGMVSPAVFVPLAERSGLILDIGRWVAETACSAAASWDTLGLPRPMTVSVNVSSRQLEDPRLAADLLHAMAETGLPPDLLEIEITETRVLDTTGDALLALAAVRDIGVTVALDDFGTGFSSLSHLRRLPLTTLKIDRTFVRDLPHDKDDAAIVRALIEIGRGLGLRVVAEGIETKAQLAFLQELGCPEGQGYLFCPPVPAEGLAERVARIEDSLRH